MSREVENVLSTALNDSVVRRLAGTRSYAAGLDYLLTGAVEYIETAPNGVRASVRGTRDYTVLITSDEGVLDYACDCPHGSAGAFCKHCVATALACLSYRSGLAAVSGAGKAKEVTLTDAEEVLKRESKEDLVRMLIDWAREDDRIRERILLLTARRLGPQSGAAAILRSFKKAARVRDYVHYREAGAWAHRVDNAIDEIDRLLNDGYGSDAIELCESALQELDAMMGSIDDSDGYLSTLRDRLEAIHLKACQQANPDAVSLAQRLFRLETQSDLEIFLGAAARYAKILGRKGLEEYKRLAEAEWAKVPARGAGDRSSTGEGHFRITHIMESIATASGDLEARIAVMSRDLSYAYHYLRIAEVYREARQYDQALLWAEKGLQAFPERTDPRLREFIANEYHRRGRHEDAMKLIWTTFSETPGLEAYKLLQRHASEAKAWPEWRERALAEIRRRIAMARQSSKGQPQHRWIQPKNDNSMLVEILLHEDDSDAAWREAQAGGCSDRLWLRLAEAREKDHPEDAAPIYMKQAEQAIAGTSNSRYDEPVSLLVKAAALMKRMDRSREFSHHLESLRVRHKARRNLLKLLDKKEKALYLE